MHSFAKKKMPISTVKNPLKIHSTALFCTTLIRNLPQNYVTFLVESPSRVLPRKPRNRRQQQKCAAGENLSTVLRNWWRTENRSLLQKEWKQGEKSLSLQSLFKQLSRNIHFLSNVPTMTTDICQDSSLQAPATSSPSTTSIASPPFASLASLASSSSPRSSPPLESTSPPSSLATSAFRMVPPRILNENSGGKN